MKKIYLALIVFTTLGIVAQPSKKIKVLFIGNSYTFVNNLPQLVANIALANGDTLIADSNCPGGFTFANHSTDAVSISKITGLQWKYVVLQAQSQEPSFSPAQVAAQTLPYAVRLDSLVKSNNPCGTTVFYETWGRKFGDASNCPFYPPICTYTGMQDRLKASYKLFADSVKGIFSPVGEAFRKSIATNPGLELYQSDQSHPSLEGSYLAASVFYELLFQKSVLSNTYNPGVTTNTLTFLQQVAHSVLNDSLQVWNIGTYMPWAEYSYSLTSGSSYQFNGLSAGTSNTWYFGDGTTSQNSSPAHSYSVSGNYTVSHVAYTNCNKDSVSKVIAVTVANTTGIKTAESITAAYVFPNPCNNNLTILLPKHVLLSDLKTELFDINGRCVYSGAYKNETDIRFLNPGFYAGKVSSSEVNYQFRFVKSE